MPVVQKQNGHSCPFVNQQARMPVVQKQNGQSCPFENPARLLNAVNKKRKIKDKSQKLHGILKFEIQYLTVTENSSDIL